jgi:hypothetical protein
LLLSFQFERPEKVLNGLLDNFAGASEAGEEGRRGRFAPDPGLIEICFSLVPIHRIHESQHVRS